MLDPAAFDCWSIDYAGTLDIEDRATVERYLQRCLFDDTISLDSMLENRQLGGYLRGCIDHTSGSWRFPQRVWLIFFADLAERMRDWRRS
jgi:hypothetical protein